MTIDIEKYSLAKLLDVSLILSPTGYVRFFTEDVMYGRKKTFINCPDSYSPSKMEFSVVEADGFEKGFAIVPNSDKMNIMYLACVLNSYISWALMTEGKVEEKTSVTLKKLSNISVRILPSIIQKQVACLYLLILDIRQQKAGGIDYPILDYWQNVYKEALNAISFELVIPQLFKEYEISILESWCSIIDQCSNGKTEINLEELKTILGEELLKPQNQLIGNMRKLRIVLNTLTERAKEEV